MKRFALVRSFVAAAVVFGAMGAGAAHAIDNAVLSALYGEGAKWFYAGDYRQAHDVLTQAIDAGTKDPRCYYFRGLCSLRLGREPDAQLDFTKGSELEGADFDVFYNVSNSLRRIQGPERLALEKYRAEARKLALKEIERIRFQHYQNFAAEMAARGAASVEAGATTGEAVPAASGASPASPAAPVDNPFGGGAPAANPFGGAPAAPAPNPPAANPFGNPN